MKILATFTPIAAFLLAAPPALAEVAPAPQWPPPAPAGEVAPLPPTDPDWAGPAEGAEPSRPRKVRSIQSGLYLGFRESAAFPGGKVAEGAGNDLDSVVLFAMPFRLEAGFRFPFGLGLGAWGQAGWVIPDCSGASSCAGAVWGYGVQADIRFNQRGRAMPWVGASYGREYLFMMIDDGYDTWDTTYSGTEVAFQAGIDFRAGNHFALGPHVQYTVGTFDEVRVEVDGYGSQTLDIPGDGQAEHSWFTIGLKGTATF